MKVALAHRGGLRGQYFNNRWLFGDAVTTRVDPSIDFAWSSFITATGKDYISVRWTGYVQPAFSEAYTFFALVNDGAKVWINGILLIDQFDNTVSDGSQEEFEGTTPAPLVAGRLYDIVVEYKENTGSAKMSLLYSSPSQPKSVIPSNRLFHSETEIASSPFTVHV